MTTTQGDEKPSLGEYNMTFIFGSTPSPTNNTNDSALLAEAERRLRDCICRNSGFTLEEYYEIHGEMYSSCTDLHFGVNDTNQQNLKSLNLTHDSDSICGRNFDRVLCWPDTAVGETATLPCFRELGGVLYDITENATRYCYEGPNGTGIWNTTNYSLCKPLNGTANERDTLALITGTYFVGYCLSLAALTIAMIIFLTIKELRCLRNVIHTHLIVTYILVDMMWIIKSTTLQESQGQPIGGQLQVSCFTDIILIYFNLTNFFWMFVEGLYLYVLVVQTFVAENIKLRIYVAIGWGVPLVIVIPWAIARWYTHPMKVVASVVVGIGNSGSHPTVPELDENCVWFTSNSLDWIYKAPVILTLAANAGFLLQIMWVLITKLRSATNPETQQSVKAAKALVVLMPLLGIPYLLMMAGIKDAVYEFIRTLLISTQGFLVALLYCLLNGEVRKALRHRWNRWRGWGSNCFGFQRRRRMQQMRAWSPGPGTESIRLYNPPPHNYRKRESSTSEATTVTTVHIGYTANGNQRKVSSTYSNNKLYPNPKTPVLKEEPASSYAFSADCVD